MQRHLMLASAMALGLTACNEPTSTNSAAESAPVAEETREEHLAAVTADAERIYRESLAREEAENRRKLDLIPANPEPPTHSGDQRWYVAAPKFGRCENLRESIGVDTPDEVVRMFAANNMPLDVTRRDEDVVMVREAGNPSDPGMAFVRGAPECDAVLQMLMAL